MCLRVGPVALPRGSTSWRSPRAYGHEYVGIVEEIGKDVASLRPGEFVVGGFYAPTAPVRTAGRVSVSCVNSTASTAASRSSSGSRRPMEPCSPPATSRTDLVPHLLALSDVMSTGWHSAVTAGVGPGSTVAVVGDGAVGLCAVLAARELGAERIIAMSRHESRQKIATEFGATDIVADRGDDGVAAIMDLTDGIGADAVCEAVGTAESMTQAVRSVRPGGLVGVVGVPHGVELPVTEIFFRNVGIKGGPASVPEYLPDLLDRVLTGDRTGPRVRPELPLAQVADAYAAMDERRAIKALLEP